MSGLDEYLQSNGCTPSRVVYVEEDDKARQGELFSFYLLWTHDIEALTIESLPLPLVLRDPIAVFDFLNPSSRYTIA